ncbi:MAG: heme o synthase [Flavobacteriales bacterium]
MASTNTNKDYSLIYDIKEFIKFRLALLVVFTAAITYITALKFNHKEIDWISAFWLCFGGMLVTVGSNGFNQIFEKNLDKLMSRTKNRPLPTGRMSLTTAWSITLVCGISGSLILWFKLNPLTGILGLLSLILYSFVYTPMKQKTPWAVLIGAFPGAAPPLIGWAACEAVDFMWISPVALSVFCIQFMWQFPHFWAIAWRCHDDYQKAGFQLLPSSAGKDAKSAFQILIYTLFMVPIAMLPCHPDFGLAGFTSSLIVLTLGIIMLYPAIMLMKTLDEKWATKLMFASFIYLPLVLITFLTDQFY